MSETMPQVDIALQELDELESQIKNDQLTLPEPGSKEWLEIREQDSYWAEKIRPILSGLEVTELIEPSGGEGRSLNEEKDRFLESLDDETSDHCPEFSYPNLEEIDLDGKEEELSEIRDEIKEKSDEGNEAQQIVTKLYHYKINEELARVRWLKAVKDGDDNRAFRYSNFIYGSLRDEHVELANKRYDELIEMVDSMEDEEESWKQGYQNIDEAIYESKDIQKFFRAVIEEYGFEDQWNVEITDEVSSITDQYKHKNGPRIAIPVGRKVSAEKLLELSAHEIEAHALSDVNGSLSDLFILSGDIQPDRTEDIEEGKAVIRQEQALQEIFGESYETTGGLPWYVFAMAQAKNGANFRETFQAVEEKRYQYELRKADGDKEKARSAAQRQTWVTCRRVFRSITDLSQGGRFFSKDKSYLSGRNDVDKVVSASKSPWLDIGKVNIRTLPEMFQLGVNPENIKHPYKNATKIVWGKTLSEKHKL